MGRTSGRKMPILIPVGGSVSGHRAGSIPGRSVSVLVLDVEQAMAEAVAQALSGQAGIAETSASHRPQTALHHLDTRPVDVLVVGVDADDEWDPLAFVTSARTRRPPRPGVAMSDDEDPALVLEAVRVGTTAWVPKRAQVHELAAAVVGVTRGEATIPPAILWGLLELLAAENAREGGEKALDRLTARERQVLQQMSDGLTRREIAAQQGISVNTVRTHVQRILTKLELHTTLEAVTLLLDEQSAHQLPRQRGGPPSAGPQPGIRACRE